MKSVQDRGVVGDDFRAGPRARQAGLRRAEVKEAFVLVVLLAARDGQAHEGEEGKGTEGHDQIR